MTKKKDDKKASIVLGEPVDEVVDFLTDYFGQVEKEGRKVKGLDRIKALKKSLDDAKK
ncbi:hypothetical protein [Pseudodesulfovibrio sediminis]|uniref:Uncharacterized protein n=1 Tax=Pseudodesulfovibrio sediminis TaxID=2810563 RepID=A0ABN6EPW3_9BACT|nr:hypothetical protein [Pseudodesulfovibrio sediminis]BCS87333.1 hypothetical protein PSDVSF_05750 [Pseudodesulfovibrio sediminis]